MQTSIIAHRYAQAFFRMSQTKKVVDRVAEDLKTLTLLYNTNKKLVEFLTYPERSPKEKYRFVETIINGKAENLTLRFMELLINKNRIGYLPEITESYQALKNSFQGIVKARVITAFPLNDRTQSTIREKLNRLTGKKVILDIEKNRSLLGGMTIQIGDTVFDGSIQQRLKSLHDHLLELIRSGN